MLPAMFSLRVLTFNAQLIIGVAATLLLCWGLWLERRGRSGFARRGRERALAALGVLGLAAFFNFGWFSGGRFLHVWDTYHYYVGAKYFPEMGHRLLYACTAVADAEAGLRRDVEGRTMTDLHTNLQIPTLGILEHPEECKARFTAARWQSFQHDVGWFRERMPREGWHKAQRDHGYNATPVWHLLGYALSNTGDASAAQIYGLVLLDLLLLLGAFAVLWRCFSWRVAAIAAIALGTYFPARIGWNGGAFLRYDWLFWMIAGLGALRRQRPMLGGAALAYSAMLRLFPAALFAAPALAALEQLRRTRRLERQSLRFFAGAALAVAVAVPPALAVSGDWGAGFVANTRKHSHTPLTNHMGLPTVLAYRPGTSVQALREEVTQDELIPRFKEERLAAGRRLRPVVLVVALAALWLLWRAAPLPLWQGAALSLILVPIGLELTCYYYVFAVALAVLAARRDEAGSELASPAGALVVALGAGSLVAFALFNPRASADVAYVAQSALALVAMGALAVITVRAGRRQARRSQLVGAEGEQAGAAGQDQGGPAGAQDDLAAPPGAGAAK